MASATRSIVGDLALAMAVTAGCGRTASEPPASSKPPMASAPMSAPAPASIGQAEMRPDGTIVLTLRAEDGHGSIGDGQLVYAPSNKDYAAIMQHIGGIKPGEVKPVPPWP